MRFILIKPKPIVCHKTDATKFREAFDDAKKYIQEVTERSLSEDLSQININDKNNSESKDSESESDSDSANSSGNEDNDKKQNDDKQKNESKQ